MDKTPLFINIPNTNTITKIGLKDISIKTYLQERVHVTAILRIVADINELSSMLVLKGRPDGKVERILHKNSLVKDKRYLLVVNLRHRIILQ